MYKINIQYNISIPINSINSRNSKFYKFDRKNYFCKLKYAKL